MPEDDKDEEIIMRSGDNEEFKEVVARRYLKGEIMEKDLAYRTAKGQLIDRLKMEFEIFCKKFLEDEL